MPFPVAHGLLSASVAVALNKPSRQRRWKTLLIPILLGVSPDFDYALNWLQIPPGGWHHGFTHSIVFAFALGLMTAIVVGERNVRSVVVYSSATVSHTLLDFMMTESRGVALWWPFTDQRYKLRLANPINYDWSDSSLWEAAVDTLRISLFEFLLFAPILLAVVLIKRLLTGRPEDTDVDLLR